MLANIEQECPQCGAPVELTEVDRLLRCPYCGVKNYLFAPEGFRFILPHKDMEREIFFVPYLRFKGCVFVCQDREILHRILDLTHPLLGWPGLPPSLGLRPQAMRLRFADPKIRGRFLSPVLSMAQVMDKAVRQVPHGSKLQALCQAHIGEAVSLIFLPVYPEHDELMDGVISRPIGKCPQDLDVRSTRTDPLPAWILSFLATLCPQCGWNLEGERDSAVLFCPNCETAWEPSGNGFSPVSMKICQGRGSPLTFLPFWEIEAEAADIGLSSFADLLRLTNQPLVIRSDWEGQSLTFVIPAFKIRPDLLLNLSRRLTLSIEKWDGTQGIPKDTLYPVTLPPTEAIQALKVILAACCVDRRKVFPLLPHVTFHVKGYRLLYIPFLSKGQEMIQEDLSLGINRNALEFGRAL